MSIVLTNGTVSEPVQFFVVGPTGKMGPYTSRTIAEGVIQGFDPNTQSQYIIESRLPDGRQVLFG